MSSALLSKHVVRGHHQRATSLRSLAISVAGGPEPELYHMEPPRDQSEAEQQLLKMQLYFAVTPSKILVTIPISDMPGLPAFVEDDRHLLPTFTNQRLYQQFWQDHPDPTVQRHGFGRQVLAVLRKESGLGLTVNPLANGTQGGWYWTAKELKDL